MSSAPRSNIEGSGGLAGVFPSGASTAADLPVRPGEEPWTDAELKEVRAELESEVASLRADLAKAASDIAERLTDAVRDAGDDTADAGT
jgi:DnaK suppressor protein